MISFKRLSLRHKITALILAASCIVLFLSTSIFVATQILTYKRLTMSELNAVSDIIGSNVTAAVLFDDPASAEETLAALRAKPAIVLAQIYLNDGSLFAEYRARGRDAAARAPDPTIRLGAQGERMQRVAHGYIDVAAPIVLDGDTVGSVFLRSDLTQMYDIIDAYLVLGASVILLLITIAFVVAARLQKVVSEPVLHLLDTMERVSKEQDYSVRARKFEDDELGQLADGFNHMLEKVQSHDDDLRAAWHEAEAASRAKTEFLANMSHELRTPLNAVIGFSEIIKAEILGPLGTDRYRFYAQDIYDSGQHLLEVINDILDISKVESGEFELHEEKTDVAELIGQCQRLVREKAEAAHLKIEVEAQPGLPALLVDPRLIKQSLINLLSNAIKFSPEGGRVTVRAALVSDGAVCVSVRDEGIGIAPEDLKKVLQPFAQVESAFSRSHEGTGLGLPLTKSFVETHGGSLEIESTLGHGTVVTLRFPPERILADEDSAGRSAVPAQ